MILYASAREVAIFTEHLVRILKLAKHCSSRTALRTSLSLESEVYHLLDLWPVALGHPQDSRPPHK